MKWNQKGLLKAGKQIAKAVGARDFEGETADEFVKWLGEITADRNVTYEGLMEDSEFDADTVRKAWKAVHITPDAGEEIIVNDPTMTEEMDGEDEETKEVDPDEEMSKAYKAFRKVAQKHGQKVPTFMKSIHEASTKGYGNKGPAIHDGAERRNMKMYNDAVKNGGEYRGKRPLFADAEISQKFGAAVRLMATKGGHYRHYSQIDNDCAIIGTKAGSTTDNAFAASLIVHELSGEIIDNLVENGAMRNAVKISPQPDGFYEHPRKTANMTMSYRDENGAFTETNPSFDRVGVTAKEAGGICRVSMSLLNDSAFNLGDQVAQATIEGRNEFEDEEYFNGTYGTHGGLLGTCGADSDATYDAQLATNWDDWTINKLQAARAKVPAKAWKRGNVKMACSTSFLQSVIYRFALSAGGNSGDRLLIGMTNGQLHWDGVPIVLTEVLPSTYTANQIVAYIGDFDAGSKVGIVTGSEGLSSSDQRYWELDQFAWKYTQRIGFAFHDVTGTNSMVIAIKD